MNKSKLVSWVAALSLFLCGIAASATAWADPPSRVVRLAHASGTVSFSPAGEDEWVRAVVNRPLIAGDRLWVDDGSRAELRLNGAAVPAPGIPTRKKPMPHNRAWTNATPMTPLATDRTVAPITSI